MKKAFLTCFSLVLLIISCKKSDDPVTTTPQPDKYMSITTNSKWTYDVITNPGPAQTAVIDTVTASGTDTAIGTRTYRIFTHSNGNTSDYYNISGNDYYRYQKVDLGGTLLAAEDLYLKDNQPATTTWSETVNVDLGVGSIPITITNSITAVGETRTVNGNSYTGVIETKTVISSTSPGVPTGSIISDIKSYYAPKVGLIEADYKVQIALASIDINTQTLLKTATIQ